MFIQYNPMVFCYWAFFGDSRTSIDGNWSWKSISDLKIDLDFCGLKLVGNKIESVN